MKHLYAEFITEEGSERLVGDLVAQLTISVRAEEGCHAFEAFTRQDDPRHWVVFEAYRDERAFLDHLASEHSRRFNAEISSHIVGGASTLTLLVAPEVPAA